MIFDVPEVLIIGLTALVLWIGAKGLVEPGAASLTFVTEGANFGKSSRQTPLPP